MIPLVALVGTIAGVAILVWIRFRPSTHPRSIRNIKRRHYE